MPDGLPKRSQQVVSVLDQVRSRMVIGWPL